MNSTILERSVSSLEKSLDSLEAWLAFMTALVVIGLVFEYFHEVPEAISEIRKRWAWRPLFVIMGGILITVGVAGELFVQVIASRKETKLRQVNDEIFAGLNIEAATARKESSAADERSRSAEERAAKANKLAAANEKEAARLGKLAEDERLARVRIEESVAWRRLTKEDRQQLANNLRPFSGMSAMLTYNPSDTEAFIFGSDIALALFLCGWKPSEPMPVLSMAEGPVPWGTNPPPDTGVVISFSDNPTSRKAAVALVRELKALGYDSKEGHVDLRKNPIVFISLEPRPQGPQGKSKLRHQAEASQP